MRNEATIELARPIAIPSIWERAAQLLDPTIFYALLILIALTAIPYGTVHPWWEALFECTVFALTALWIVEGLLSGTWEMSEHRLLVPLIALIVFAFVQTLTIWPVDVREAGIEGRMWRALSADPYETRRFTLNLIALTLSGVLLLRYSSSRRRLRTLIYVVIGLGVASALFGFVRQMIQGDAASFILPRLSPGRGYGQFINANHFAFLMEMALGLVLGLIVRGGVRRDHLLLYLAAAFPMWAAIILSNSRGGILSMICQLLFLALMFDAARSQREYPDHYSDVFGRLRRLGNSFVVRVALIVCLILIVTVSIVWIGGDPLAQRFESTSKEFIKNDANNRTNTSRIEMWSATRRLIEAKPLVGVGFGGYAAAITKYHDGSGELRPRQAHNDYLDLLACGGVVGFALVAWFVVVFIKQARERLRSADSFRRAACLGAFTGIFGVAVHSLVEFGLHITAIALVFTSILVIATVKGRVDDMR